jgi:hypothetical protein
MQAVEIVCAIAFDAATTPWQEADTILDIDLVTVTALAHAALMVIKNARWAVTVVADMHPEITERATNLMAVTAPEHTTATT